MTTKITPIGNGFDNPRAMLAALLETEEEIEWAAITYQTKNGRFSNYTNNMTLADLACMACSWLGLFHSFDGG
jgi:hypothetical protein